MNKLEAIFLGIIQGVTEFLPISSSGHLEIVKALFGNESIGKESLFLTLVLHFGTALSTMVVFRKEIKEILLGVFSFKPNEKRELAIKIVISMIPAAFIGLFFQEQIEMLFAQNLILVGIMLLVTAASLFLADLFKNTKKGVSFLNAFLVGIIQAIAVLPGISRSGFTISSAILLGIDREKAARFSFLMVLPLIFGSMAKTALDLKAIPENINPSSLLLGFIFAFISGILACNWMISMVKKSQLKYFGFYCVVIGGLILFYGLF